jgi:hypothetical protein
MTDDPRAQVRQHPYYDRGILPTQLEQRIKQGLSPSDDELPMAQAVGHKDEMEQASKAWRKRRKN